MMMMMMMMMMPIWPWSSTSTVCMGDAEYSTVIGPSAKGGKGRGKGKFQVA